MSIYFGKYVRLRAASYREGDTVNEGVKPADEVPLGFAKIGRPGTTALLHDPVHWCHSIS